MLWTNTTPCALRWWPLTVASAAPAATASELNVPVLTPGKGVSLTSVRSAPSAISSTTAGRAR